MEVWLRRRQWRRRALGRQARRFRELVRLCLDMGIDDLTVWGATDRYSWVTGEFGGEWGDALLWDANYRPKPALRAVRREIERCPSVRRG
jgi:GH35 family endo-1,4-beta-xylanase